MELVDGMYKLKFRVNDSAAIEEVEGKGLKWKIFDFLRIF